MLNGLSLTSSKPDVCYSGSADAHSVIVGVIGLTSSYFTKDKVCFFCFLAHFRESEEVSLTLDSLKDNNRCNLQ